MLHIIICSIFSVKKIIDMKFMKLTDMLNENKDNITIYCDMDGVLTGFVEDFKSIPSNTENLTPEEYSDKHGKHSIWKIVDEMGLKWWSHMSWHENGKKLWKHISKYNPIILSSPSRHPNSSKGKLQWINNYLNIPQNYATTSHKRWNPESRIILSTHKHLFCKGPNDILIDDTKKKIDAWESAGGTTIHYKDFNKAIKELNKLIDKS